MATQQTPGPQQHPRRRRAAVLVAAAVVVVLASVQLWAAGDEEDDGAPAGATWAVPTFAWDPAQGGDAALMEGTVTLTADGCAVVEREQGRTGVVLPNAKGVRQADGRSTIVSTFPDGSAVVMAAEGLDVGYGGGGGGVTDEWSRLCPRSPVDSLFQVYATTPSP